MRHIELKTNPDTYYGINVNSRNKLALVQLGDTLEQIRVALTKEELEQFIKKLQDIHRKLI